MRIFISWSGIKSKATAEILREWLPNVIQSLDPWISSQDIGKGARWSLDIVENLEQASVGIICLTKGNVNSPWILFEAGALSKTLDKSLVCPYLIDFDESELDGPLIQFQSTRANKVETKKLLETLNTELGKKKVGEKVLASAFENWWPKLEKALNGLSINEEQENDQLPKRKDSEMLVEILKLARDFKRSNDNTNINYLEISELEDLLRTKRMDAALIERRREYEYELRMMEHKLEFEQRRVHLEKNMNAIFEDTQNNAATDLQPGH